jgi:paraquat-inducible protein A
MNPVEMTAKKSGMVSCSCCHLLCDPPQLEENQQGHCPRCDSVLHSRKPNSLSRCWALVIAACVLMVPAQMMPITITSAIGFSQADTIMSGVIYFTHSGLWPIALIIFIASVFVPVAKLLILVLLMLSVQLRWHWRPRDRTRLYRVTELVGRWSMVDVYVVTILVALVKLGAIAAIDAGPGAAFFAGVVIITMFAAESFDPRLIWDVLEDVDAE